MVETETGNILLSIQDCDIKLLNTDGQLESFYSLDQATTFGLARTKTNDILVGIVAREKKYKWGGYTESKGDIAVISFKDIQQTKMFFGNI